MDGARRCATCGSPLDGDQRYCLTCGERDGERSPQLRELMSRAAGPEGAQSADGGASAAADSEGTADAASGSDPPHLPGPRMSALLVAVFVGFGALVGNAAGGGGPVPASAVRLLAPPSQSDGASSSGAGAGSEETGSGAPEAEPEETPAPAEEQQAESPGGGSGGGDGSSEAGAGHQGEGGSRKPAGGGSHGSGGSARHLTDIKHVFVIVLSNQPYASLFGPESSGRYLAGTLERKGELLVSYDAIAHEQLPNGIALISGQGPTPQTAANCPTYNPVTPASPAADGQVLGDGCVYPGSVETLPGELAVTHLGWRAYVQGIGEDPSQPGPCGHPAPGTVDATLAGGPYATFRDPFVYFESIVQSPGCQANIVGLSQLKADLTSAAKTPSLSYIVPDRCHDAEVAPCTPGAAAGPAAASALLEQLVPEILASAAYKRDGLLVITADEAPSAGELADSSSCCGQPSTYPNYTSPLLGHGGGQVGALLLSPFVKGGTTSQQQYDHFSLLRTIEDVFGVPHLGYSALPAVKPFAAALLNA